MALHDLTLIYGAISGVISVTFRNWRSTELPRSRKTFVTESSYAVSGNLIKAGTSFELPYIWAIAADLYQEDYDKIKAIWEQLDRARRVNNGDLFVNIDDETEEIYEFGKTAATKTRSSIGTTTPRELNGGVYYYARFQADWVAPAQFGRWGISRKTGNRVCPVSLVLQDTRFKV
jgi:hypothetical protein